MGLHDWITSLPQYIRVDAVRVCALTRAGGHATTLGSIVAGVSAVDTRTGLDVPSLTLPARAGIDTADEDGNTELDFSAVEIRERTVVVVALLTSSAGDNLVVVGGELPSAINVSHLPLRSPSLDAVTSAFGSAVSISRSTCEPLPSYHAAEAAAAAAEAADGASAAPEQPLEEEVLAARVADFAAVGGRDILVYRRAVCPVWMDSIASFARDQGVTLLPLQNAGELDVADAAAVRLLVDRAIALQPAPVAPMRLTTPPPPPREPRPLYSPKEIAFQEKARRLATAVADVEDEDGL